MDLSRHIEVFSPDRVLNPVHIIGVGATGSFVAQMLVRMGLPTLNIYDFDDVEIHNIPNQSYDTTHLGMSKVDALTSVLKAINPEVNVNVFNKRVLEEDMAKMEGYVFNLVDGMKTRKELWLIAKENEKILHMWESRLGSDQARVYSLQINKDKDYTKYENDFYDDDVAEESACGTSITVLPIVLQTASLMMTQFIDLIMDRGDTNTFKVIFDNQYNKYEEYWEEVEQETPATQEEEDIF